MLAITSLYTVVAEMLEVAITDIIVVCNIFIVSVLDEVLILFITAKIECWLYFPDMP